MREYLFHNLLIFFLTIMSNTSPDWNSAYSDWYNRTSLLPSSTPISKQDFLFTVTYSAMGGDGLDIAVFKPNIVVTSAGEIRKVQADDFIGLSKLAENVSMLPIPKNSRGRGVYAERAFRIHHEVSCRPFTILNFLKTTEDGKLVLDKTSVYGYSKSAQVLEDGGKLPDVLWELLGLVSEAPNHWDAEVDDEVLKRIKEISSEFGS